MIKEIEHRINRIIVSDGMTIFVGSVIGTAMILALLILWFNLTWGNYQYKIKVGIDDYYCNEYRLEFDKLYLSDCSGEDAVINNPTNYRIEER